MPGDVPPLPNDCLVNDRCAFLSSLLDSTTHAARLDNLKMPRKSIQDAIEATKNCDCWWLDVVSPTERELDTISKVLSSHALTIEHSGAQEFRDKAELFHEQHFFYFDLLHGSLGMNREMTPNLLIVYMSVSFKLAS
jgi:Mg2+ and Co2+ transporter CorA